MTMTESTPDVFPLKRQCPYAPPATYTQFRETGGLHKIPLWDGREAWLATRYADVRAMLGDDAHISSDIGIDGFPLAHSRSREFETGALMRIDNPQHDAQRRILTREFSVKRLEAWRPRVLEITDDVIDEMLAKGESADLVVDFAHQIPARIICEMLGLTPDERDEFLEHAQLVTDYATPEEERGRAQSELAAMLEGVIDRKEREPADDIVSRLVHEHHLTGEIDRARLQSFLALLFVGGQDTTANMIGLSVLTMLEHPDQLAPLADPSSVNLAVEELLRFLTVNQGEPRRVVAHDTEVGGCPVARGDAIIASLHAANFDPDVFDREQSPASELDLTRGARNHVAFGFGTHQCLGQNLARIELQVAVPRLFERLPGLRLDVDPSDLPYRTTAVIYGLESLPVSWGSE